MTWKLTSGALGFVLLGVVATVVLQYPGPQVAAQPAAQQWEYKVVVFNHEGDFVTDRDGQKNADRFDKQFNALTAAGWEYVGPVCNPSGHSRGYVAFRHAKR